MRSISAYRSFSMNVISPGPASPTGSRGADRNAAIAHEAAPYQGRELFHCCDHVRLLLPERNRREPVRQTRCPASGESTKRLVIGQVRRSLGIVVQVADSSKPSRLATVIHRQRASPFLHLNFKEN